MDNLNLKGLLLYTPCIKNTNEEASIVVEFDVF